VRSTDGFFEFEHEGFALCGLHPGLLDEQTNRADDRDACEHPAVCLSRLSRFRRRCSDRPLCRQRQVGLHFGRSGITVLRVGIAGIEEDFVEFKPFLPLREFLQTGERIGPSVGAAPSAEDIKYFAQRVEVPCTEPAPQRA